MKIIKSISALVIATVIIASCSKKPAIEYTSTVNMSGEWFTRYYFDGAPVAHFTRSVRTILLILIQTRYGLMIRSWAI